ncbi:MAG: hypothetical protein R6V49_00840 [Bacteroidales bacterium]
MDRNQLGRAVRSRKSLEETGVAELRQLAGDYPWCHTFHLILLKKMHTSGDASFHTQLNRSAIHVSDRSVLYHLIHGDRFSTFVARPYIPESYPEDPLQQEERGTEPEIPVEIPADELVPSDAAEPEIPVEVPAEDTERAARMEPPVGKPVKTELIEKFIEAEPRIVPREGDFKESVQIAEKSNIPAMDFVTETLANIYLEQGNRGKAIKIFEKLSLTIPEKSSYFAARIKEIRFSHNRL